MNKIYNKLLKYKDDKYKEFSSKIIPNIDNIIGVKIPNIRIVKNSLTELEKGQFILELPHKYLEENILHSMIISDISNIDLCLEKLDEFSNYMDNWEVTDMIKNDIFKSNLDLLYKYIIKWINSDKTYTVRLGIVLLIYYYLDNENISKYNDLVIHINSEDYYVNMAISWYLSFALIKHYDETIILIENKKLSKFIQNKTISKCIDSYRISDDKKEYLKTLRK